jgi:predicted nucleotidyltransferase
MTLGNYWGCASFWHSVYYRVWRIGSSGSKLLVDGSGDAYMRSESWIVGSIVRERRHRNSPVDVLVEFTERSIDGGVHNREAIRHFLIDGDQVLRVDPVALSPRDFVDEWLTRGWDESASWSASPSLRQWHRKLHTDWIGGQFSGTTMHCRTSDLWQVTFGPDNAQKDFESEPDVYFLVRWRPPYHFTMVNVSDKPWPRCTQEDRQADEWRTLFSTQEWRR